MNDQTCNQIQAPLRPKILIADDGAYIRRLLSIPLGKKYEIIEADSGAAALGFIELHKPKLVLMDIMMPGVMNGLQVLDIIKADPRFKDIFVGLMTARGQIKDGAIAKKRGADAYFVKPFSPADVVAWVDSMLHSTLQ